MEKTRGEQRYLTDETQQESGAINDKLIQDGLEKEDGAHLLLSKHTHGKLCERIGNFDISTETRELTIQRANVALLIHSGRALAMQLPPTFGQIKQGAAGTLVGKEVNTTGDLREAAGARIRKAKYTWELVNGKIFRNKIFSPEIKILLWTP